MVWRLQTSAFLKCHFLPLRSFFASDYISFMAALPAVLRYKAVAMAPNSAPMCTSSHQNRRRLD